MSGDYSRMRFDPGRDFCGLLQQQGRVHLDSDANELVHIVDRRQRAQTVDTIGRCTVPRETANGFQIAIVDRTLTIGRGRIYVDGMLAENHGREPLQFDPCLAEEHGGAILYTEQPYFPEPTNLPDSAGPHLVYVMVYQREVTPLQRPDLVETAIGVDTATALQTVWQVRVLPDVGLGVTCATPLEQIPKWRALTRPSSGRLTTSAAEAVENDDPCIIPLTGFGYRGLENQLYRVEIHRGGPVGKATFKWSRDNASVGTGVLAIQGMRLSVASLGRDAILRFGPGDWIEVTDDVRELSGLPPEMCRITNVEDSTRTIEIDEPLPAAAFPVDARGQLDARRHTRIRRWDHRGVALDASDGAIPVPPAGKKVVLENGIEVSFDLDADDGEFREGDYWTFAARTVDGSVESLQKARPRGIHRHYGRLAVITFPADVKDCRVIWPPDLAPKKDAERAIHVKGVFVGGEELRNDSDIPFARLARGLHVEFDAALDERSVRGKPICTVTLDLPYPMNDSDIAAWHGADLLGFQPVHLAATITSVENALRWDPHDATRRWIERLLPIRLQALHRELRVLVHLTLKGNFIFSRENPERPTAYLDGEVFGMLRNGMLEARLPSGDGQRGGDLEMWFWLVG
jgi:hypothetical protein